ncbi:hypothetical protein F5884DRAFT_869304 [Xylogone sp. PMI_703]|nr:hypothetical protein F5884DRAFT_869304 [Xylogone sp. PMI_703]
MAALARQIEDKATNFRGRAQVRISHLAFPNPIRQIDENSLAQLKKAIIADGCLHKQYRIPAVIDDQILQTALNKARIDVDAFEIISLDDPPKLRFSKGTELECLDGQHRILAAKQIPLSEEEWWTLELYGKGLSNDARQSLRDGYFYSANYTDGEIFRHFRRCKLAGDENGEQHWRARYSQAKDRKLKQVLKRKDLLAALDSLLPVRGLWKAFHAGSVDILIIPKCDEEICHYIKCIKETWGKILEGDKSLMESTDEFTVEALQLRVPALSRFDAEFVQNQMTSGRLFPEIWDPAARQGITSRLMTIEHPIPTIHSLFKNLLYIEPAVRMIRDLIPKPWKGSLREALRFHFDAGSTEDALEIQIGEHSYATFTGNYEHSFDLAVRQIFLCAIRYSAKPPRQREHSYSIAGLADLAEKLGFSSSRISTLMKNDIYQKMVLDLLYRILPTQKAADIETGARPIVRELRELVNALGNPPADRSTPWSTVSGLGEPLSRRCGPEAWVLSDNDKDRNPDDLNHIFLDKMHIPLVGLGVGRVSVLSISNDPFISPFLDLYLEMSNWILLIVLHR